MDVQVRLGQEFLELIVLGLQVAQLGRIGGLHAAKARAPLVKGRLAKATRAANVLDGHARFSLLEESDDLLVGKSCGLHTRHSPKLADFVPSIWYGSEGAGQDEVLCGYLFGHPSAVAAFTNLLKRIIFRIQSLCFRQVNPECITILLQETKKLFAIE